MPCMAAHERLAGQRKEELRQPNTENRIVWLFQKVIKLDKEERLCVAFSQLWCCSGRGSPS
jgi:hypothetical protein